MEKLTITKQEAVRIIGTRAYRLVDTSYHKAMEIFSEYLDMIHDTPERNMVQIRLRPVYSVSESSSVMMIPIIHTSISSYQLRMDFRPIRTKSRYESIPNMMTFGGSVEMLSSIIRNIFGIPKRTPSRSVLISI